MCDFIIWQLLFLFILGWGLIENSVLKPNFQVEEVHDWLSSSAIYPPLELPLQPPINQNGQCGGGAERLILLRIFIHSGHMNLF